MDKAELIAGYDDEIFRISMKLQELQKQVAQLENEKRYAYQQIRYLQELGEK